MKRSLFLSALLAAGSAQATPILQTYIHGATAGDQPGDDNTWFLDGAPGDTFILDTIGNYPNQNILAIENGTLVFTVPDGQTPTIAMDRAGFPSGFVTVPLAGSFDDETAFEAALGHDFPSHAPYGLAADQVDLYALAIDTVFPGQGVFDPFVTALPDCNADVAGTTACAPGNPNQEGELFSYLMQVTGVDWIHFDLIAEVTRKQGNATVTDWEINPFSHDSTWRATPVPLPGTLALALIPMAALMAGQRRR